MEVRMNCPTDCETIHKKLRNGAQLYIVPKERKIKIGAVSFRLGATDREFLFEGEKYSIPAGTAHFLEHRMFEQKEGSVSDKFSVLGADVNAYTDGSKTTYIFKTAENFSECLKLLLSFVMKPYFVEEEIANERKIIESEINMYGDDPSWQSYFGALSALYPNSPVSEEIAGSAESISKVTPEVLYLCHKAFYVPQNMTIVAGGGVEADEIIKIADSIQSFGGEKTKKLKSKLKPCDGITNITLDISVPFYCIAFPAKIDGGRAKNGFLYRILGEMLFGESSEIFKRMVDEGLTEDVPMVQYSSDGGVGIFAVSGTSRNPKCSCEMIKKAINDFISKGEIDSKKFQLCVNRTLGEIIRSLDNAESAVNAQIEWSSESITAPEIISMVRNLSERELFWAAKEIEKHCGIGIVSNKGDK